MSGNHNSIVEHAYRAHKDNLVRMCYKLCNDIDLAKDIVQEAFIIALVSLNLKKSIDTKASVLSFLTTVIHRLAIKFYRSKDVILKNIEDITTYLYKDEQPKDSILDYYPLDQKLLEGIEKLKEMDQIVVIGYMYGFGLRELGRIYGMDDRNIHQKLKQCIRQLKEYLHEGEMTTGAELKAKKQYSEATDTIYKLRQEGWSFSGIARYLNTSVTAIRNRYLVRLENMKKYPTLYTHLINH